MQNAFKHSRVPGQQAPKGPRFSAPNSGTKPDPPKTRHQNRRHCYTSEYMPQGSSKVGLTKDNQPSKVVWELDYGLSETQFEKLSKRFPGIAFVQKGLGCHDHPIAHTSYRVVWDNVMKKLPPGSLVADISGNPDHNERYNNSQKGRDKPIHVDTFCKVMSPKDSVRAKTRWGPKTRLDKDGSEVVRWEELTLYDMYRFETNRERFAKYDRFLMNHCLYYYEMEDINLLLNLNPNSVLEATVHKLEGQSGTINCGEQEYEKDFVTGKVTQRNVETGETYSHPDVAKWFKNFAYADRNGAFAWTINKGCDDTYVVTATSTDPRIVDENCWRDGEIVIKAANCESSEETLVVGPGPEALEPPPPAYGVEEVVLRSKMLFSGNPVDKTKTVRITHPEIYSNLVKFMINKPRNTRVLQDLTAKAHREAGNNVVYGGGKKVKISAEALTQHIAAAFCAGAELEDEMFTFATSHTSSIAAMNRNLSGKSLVMNSNSIGKQVVKFALLSSSLAKSRDPVHQVLEHLDDLL